MGMVGLKNAMDWVVAVGILDTRFRPQRCSDHLVRRRPYSFLFDQETSVRMCLDLLDRLPSRAFAGRNSAKRARNMALFKDFSDDDWDEFRG